MTQAQTKAVEVAADTTACAVREIVACVPGNDLVSYRNCLATEELACLKARQWEIITAGGAVIAEALGEWFSAVRYESRVALAPEAFADEAHCMMSIDVGNVVQNCPAGKASRLCIVDAVQWCADHGAEAELVEGEGPEG